MDRDDVPQSPHLLDVLKEIPLDVVEVNLWEALTAGDHRHLRQACRRALELADEMTCSATYDLGPSRPAEAHSIVSGDSDTQAVAVTFMARMPHLTSLELSHWTSETELSTLILRAGHATHQIKSLSLCGIALSVSSCCAMRLAFPVLSELILDAPRISRNSNGRGLLVAQDAIFLPLQDSLLTKLVVRRVVFSDAARRSLCGVSGLTHLDLSEHPIPLPRYELQGLSTFTHLRHLSLHHGFWGTDITLPDFAGIFTLTTLTHLQLPSTRDDTPAAAAATAAASSALVPSNPRPPPLTDVALGGLVHLRSLRFGDKTVLRDADLAQLGRLTALTSLQMCTLEVADAAFVQGAGHLPTLRHLQVDGVQTPGRVLRTLAPLLPLPSLTTIHLPCLTIAISGKDEESEVELEAALREVMAHLAAAPCQPPLERLSFMGHGRREGPVLSVTQLAHALGALAKGLRRISWWMFTLNTFDWCAMGACFPSLVFLKLAGCTCKGGELAAIGRSLPVLRRLEMHMVFGSRSDVSLGPTAEMWQGLAAARCAPLLAVVYHCSLDATVVALCRAVQERSFGRQNVAWAKGLGGLKYELWP